MTTDEKYMLRCLQLASQGVGFVAPNPMVGAVVVHNDRIIGEGYHHKFGQPHAEPNAVNSVTEKELLPESTLYVNLEPCSFYGKTPPCADFIVRSGIRKVVIGTIDPNPKVAGKGIKILQNAGVEVTCGVLENECRELNKRFFTFQEKKRPYIILKWAQTADGFIDKKRKDVSESPLLISNSITRQLTHKFRSENQSIMIGSNTVLLDNPSLTVRYWTGKSPIRIILNRSGNIPANYNVLNNEVETVIFTMYPGTNKQRLTYEYFDFENENILALINRIYKRGIHSVLIEGGARLLTSFIEAGLWDEANVEVSEITINEGVVAPKIDTIPCSMKMYDNHKWISYKNYQNFIT
jgi:diaminohydroxyphosphoribosylaminopyrimidine deaminase/5-amino-6-(5-phosphoribosylamino)uracil reductase